MSNAKPLGLQIVDDDGELLAVYDIRQVTCGSSWMPFGVTAKATEYGANIALSDRLTPAEMFKEIMREVSQLEAARTGELLEIAEDRVAKDLADIGVDDKHPWFSNPTIDGGAHRATHC